MLQSSSFLGFLSFPKERAALAIWILQVYSYSSSSWAGRRGFFLNSKTCLDYLSELCPKPETWAAQIQWRSECSLKNTLASWATWLATQSSTFSREEKDVTTWHSSKIICMWRGGLQNTGVGLSHTWGLPGQQSPAGGPQTTGGRWVPKGWRQLARCFHHKLTCQYTCHS